MRCPATVLALGLLAPLVGVDEIYQLVHRHLHRQTVGLLVAGSGAALVIAYTVRFLAISIGFLQAGYCAACRRTSTTWPAFSAPGR